VVGVDSNFSSLFFFGTGSTQAHFDGAGVDLQSSADRDTNDEETLLLLASRGLRGVDADSRAVAYTSVSVSTSTANEPRRKVKKRKTIRRKESAPLVSSSSLGRAAKASPVCRSRSTASCRHSSSCSITSRWPNCRQRVIIFFICHHFWQRLVETSSVVDSKSRSTLGRNTSESWRVSSSKSRSLGPSAGVAKPPTPASTGRANSEMQPRTFSVKSIGRLVCQRRKVQ